MTTDAVADFCEKVGQTITRRGLPAPGACIIVGLSGGADSVALLDVMVSMGYYCIAAHMNYGLRGVESDRDMECARRVAETVGVPFLCRRVSVDRRGVSVEMACRDLRYGWFRELMSEYNAVAVAVAHHREDSVETFILNTLRRSGVAGLCGIRAFGDGVMRPLIDATRVEIESYLAVRGLDFVIDSSNASDDYKRNRVRHHVIPALEKVTDDAVGAVVATIDRLTEQTRLLDRFAASQRDAIDLGDDSYRIGDLYDDADRDAIMYAMFSGLGFTRTQTDVMGRSAVLAGTREFRASDGICWVVADGILRRRHESDECEAVVSRSIFDLGDKIEASVVSPCDFRPERDNMVAYFDVAVDDGNPAFELRTWRRGDRLKPFGMKSGSKLVSDLLREARIDADRRSSVKVLTRNGNVIWIVGVRSSRLFAVGGSTHKIVRLRAVGQRRDS